ncbi:MAG TPA: DinB family protein [Candidatus Angelobacter sp.]
MDPHEPLRRHLITLLSQAEAHVDVETTLKEFPAGLRGRKPEGSPHTPWQLLEHMRLAQWDILQFTLDPKHKSPPWPEGYWPQSDAPPSDGAWDKSIQQFLADLKSVCGFVRDPQCDLFAKIPHGEGQTYLREALLVADHNSYHLGQLVLIRRMLEHK